jgi:hypothetical protein
MRKLYAFIISTAVLFGASTASASTENEIKKITENTPLVLQHADSVLYDDSIKGHYSHSSHRSHWSHSSHRSHRSGW